MKLLQAMAGAEYGGAEEFFVRLALAFERQDSNLMALFSQADCLIIRPPFAPAAKKGDTVHILPLDIGAVAL